MLCRTPISTRFATIDEPPTVTKGAECRHRRNAHRHTDVDEDLEEERDHQPAGGDDAVESPAPVMTRRPRHTTRR
jgi:hypothetical protein